MPRAIQENDGMQTQAKFGRKRKADVPVFHTNQTQKRKVESKNKRQKVTHEEMVDFACRQVARSTGRMLAEQTAKYFEDLENKKQ